LNEFKPDLIIYNAGTDILVNDPLGKLDISPDGIKSRDEIVFKTAKSYEIPIVMLTRFVYYQVFKCGNYCKRFFFLVVDINFRMPK
jgi:hypothetical protein